MKEVKGKKGYGERLFKAYRAGLVSQAELMARIAGRPDAAETAARTVIEIDACRDREFAAAEVNSDGNRAQLAKLKAPTYQWHVRARTVLAVIAAGRWKELAGLGTYAAMYAAAAVIVRPKRKRGRLPNGNRGALVPRQVETAGRILKRADARQAVNLLSTLLDRLAELKVDGVATLTRDAKHLAVPGPRLIPLPLDSVLRKAA